MAFFSQYGQDAVLDAMFGDQRRGYFVEVGCRDGRRFSSTLVLEQRGWRGMCIEAQPSYLKDLQANRPKSTVINCAIGTHDADAITLAGHDGVTHIVPMRTISGLLDEAGVEQVDVLTIDLANTAAGEVTSLHLGDYLPRVLVVGTAEHQAGPMEAALLPAGYQFAFNLGPNRFYIRDTAVLNGLAGKKLTCRLEHTADPLTGAAGQTLNINLNFSGLRQAG